MQRRQFLSDVVKHGFVVATGAATCTASGCGSFMYSERCGQPHSNQIDWKVVALDSLGLLLFFVPGVVAFVVDFCTGAIYLPVAEVYPGYAAYGQRPTSPVARPESWATLTPPAATVAPKSAMQGQPTFGLKRVLIPGEPLRRQEIERLVAQHVGQPVSLSDARARVSVMERIAQYDEQSSRHRADSSFGFEARSILDRLISA